MYLFLRPRTRKYCSGTAFARETMKALDNRNGPVKRRPRKSWLTLYNTGRFHIEALSDDWFNDLKQKMPVLEKATGMSQDDYLRWLKANNLNHNTSNMFRYMALSHVRDR